MRKQLLRLVSFILVLDLVLICGAGAADSDLLGWWPLNEGSGNTATDLSLSGNDGTIFNANSGGLGAGGSVWVDDPERGTVISFNGTASGAYVSAGEIPQMTLTNDFTWAFWAKHSDENTADNDIILGNRMDENAADFVPRQFIKFTPTKFEWHMNGNGNDNLDYEDIPADVWLHHAVVKTGNQLTYYRNGVEHSSGVFTQPLDFPQPLFFGGDNEGSETENWSGLMSDVRVYNKALTEAELLDVISERWPYASKPEPADGALHSGTWVSISWKPGGYAVSHNVYMGDNFDDVNNGTGDTFRGNVTYNYYVAGFAGQAFPDGLVPGTTYYWRIDEVNEAESNSPWKGDVWSFTVPSKKAYNANPGDGNKYIHPDVTLTWTAGFNSILHYVYFGENFDDVNDATDGPFQIVTTYTPGALELEKTYYWRVDEFDGFATHKGDIWSFTTLPDVQITDPNLVGWWKLDEGYGTTTVDWSGRGNHGDIINTNGGFGENDSVWFDDPERGIVLSFNGDESSGAYVTAGEIPEMTLTNDFTWSFWAMQFRDGTGVNQTIIGNRYGASDQLQFTKFTPTNFEYYNNGNNNGFIPYTIPAGVWIHHAVVKHGTSLTRYLNGVVSGSSAIDVELVAQPFYMGGDATSERWSGWLSDVQLYDKALTLDEIKQVMRGDPSLAWNPNPANVSTPYITEATTLSWSPGDNASQHDVYFGTDKDAVANADASDTTGIYRGRQNAAVYNPDVEWGGGPYYWRIDEYNIDETISKGKVWSFTVTDFMGIDDFEHYDAGDNQIWYSWKDGLGYGSLGTDTYFAGNGTGSAVGDETSPSYMEQTIVHGGGKSMPIYYDNNKQGYMKYSEVEYTLTEHRDWTEQGVAELSLWFYGDATNAAEPLYVAVSNNAGAPAMVVHDDANAVQIDTWTEWVIPLSAFADQGIILTNIAKIAIGLGTQGNMTIPGGSGKMYIDDIRLYQAREAAK
jgi:hypothetical protein